MSIENSCSALLLLLCGAQRGWKHTLLRVDKGNIIKANVYIVFIEGFKVYVLALQASFDPQRIKKPHG